MAEICSAYPSAGSVYHWSAQLVPIRYAPLASYVCGWFNFVGNAAGDASFAFFFAQFFNSAISVSGGKPYYDDTVDNEDYTVLVSLFKVFDRTLPPTQSDDSILTILL